MRLDLLFNPGAGAAALRGTILHACLATVEWLEDGPPNDSHLRALVAEVLRRAGKTGDPDPWVAEFQTLLRDPLLRSQLSLAAYRNPQELGFARSAVEALRTTSNRFAVENERPFAVMESTGLLTGCIDRLVLIRDGERLVAADILDFKTDAIPAEDHAAWNERIAYYRPQVLAYRQAVQRMTRLSPDRVASRLILLSAKRAVPVT